MRRDTWEKKLHTENLSCSNQNCIPFKVRYEIHMTDFVYIKCSCLWYMYSFLFVYKRRDFMKTQVFLMVYNIKLLINSGTPGKSFILLGRSHNNKIYKQVFRSLLRGKALLCSQKALLCKHSYGIAILWDLEGNYSV